MPISAFNGTFAERSFPYQDQKKALCHVLVLRYTGVKLRTFSKKKLNITRPLYVNKIMCYSTYSITIKKFSAFLVCDRVYMQVL
jgi:hypothetical protein